LGEANRRDHPRYRIRLVHLQLTAKEAFEHPAAVLQQSAVLLRKQPSHQRWRRVIDLERALDHEAAAQVGPAACIEVRIPNLVFRVDAPLALALNPKLER